MRECPRCHATVEPKDIFCGSCGFKLADGKGQATVTQKEIKANDIRFNLGVVYIKLGKYEKAIETFEKILEEEPGNIQVLDMYERARQAQSGTIAIS